MKKIIAVAAAALLAVFFAISSNAQDARSIYNKYSDAPNVSAVYISPAMFRLIGKIPDLDINGSEVNLASIIKTLRGMYVLSCENPDVSASLKHETDKMISKGKYEMLMEAKDSGETVRIFTEGDDKYVNALVMLASEADECTFICLDGQMLREDLEKIIAESME